VEHPERSRHLYGGQGFPLQAHVLGVAGPGVAPQFLFQTRPEGVEVDIPDQFLEVGRPVHQVGHESPLEQVARLLMAQVEPDRIGGLELLHELGEGGRPPLFGEQVDMVGHQAVGVERDVAFGGFLAQKREVTELGRLVEEDPLAVVASDDEVVEPTLEVQTWFSHNVPPKDHLKARTDD